MPDPKAHFAFISYLRSDKVIVEEIRNRLEECAIPTWMDLRGLEAGVNWADLTEKKINAADAFLLFISSSLEKRPDSYIHKEIDIAVERLRTIHPHVRWFFPVRLETAPIPEREIQPGRLLSDYHAVDAFPSWRDAIDELALRIRTDWEQPEANACKIVFRFLALPGGMNFLSIIDQSGNHETWAHDNSYIGDDHEYSCLVEPGPKHISAFINYTQTSIETGMDRTVTRSSNSLDIVANPKETLVFSVRKSRRTGFLGLWKENGAWLTLDLISRSY